jgi:DNA-binding FadR family transcriptional regulator
MGNFAPVRRQSVAASVFDQLAAQILDGTLMVGVALPAERTLTSELGVNRQALREALQRLDQLGLVEIRHGGVTRVRDYRHHAGLDLLPRLFTATAGQGVDATLVRSVMEMRSAVGADAAALCAERMNNAGLGRLESQVEDLAAIDPGDVAQLALIDTRFWDTIVDGSANICYQLSLNSLRRAYQPLEAVVDRLLVDERADLAGHRAVVAAIATGDAQRARKAATRLLARGSAALLSELERS